VNTVSDASLAERLSRLPAERQRVLRSLLPREQRRPLGPRRPGEAVPLTFGQQRLWLLDRLLPGNPAYNETNYIRFPYALDVPALRWSINEIVRRHEILRTGFPLVDEEPQQVVAPSLAIELPLIDLRQLPVAQRESEAMRLAAEQSRAPFNLAAPPLLRASLYRLAADEYLLALTLHHMLCDGWSLGVLDVELFTHYWSRVAGKPPLLPELAVQYGDFAVWQKQSSNSPSGAQQLDYWRRQLADLPTLSLPTDRPRPAEFGFRGARQPLHIEGARYDALRSFCERENCTANLVLLTTFYVLLHRYSGQDDVPLGTPVAARNLKELEPIIGYFVNTLVLRGDLSGNPRFVDLLGRIRETLSGALAHQDVPFDQIVETLHPPRDKSRNPLFQVTFQVFQPLASQGPAKDAFLPLLPVPSGIAKFDLAVELILTDTGLRGHIEYNTDLFDPSRIERLVTHYLQLLDGALADASLPVSDLPMLTAREREQLDGWNDTAAGYPRDRSIPEIFRAQAAARPDRPAVRFGEAQFSYGELARRADRVARYLRNCNVARGEPVAVYLQRSLDMPTVLLGILMAGAAYVPLDPNYPPARLAHMLSASGARRVVTTMEAMATMPALPAEILNVSNILETDETIESELLAPAPDDVAYVIYTSGTTGMPKGVAVTHRNILRTVMNAGYADLRPGQSILQFAPISFDASTFEIWGCLLNGGVLVMPAPGPLTAEELGRFIGDSHIDVLFITTALFREIVENGPQHLRTVGQILTGGEAMSPAIAKSAWNALPRTRLSNVYGPTECTTFATAYPIEDPGALGTSVPIGRPIGNTTAYILDAHGNRVPVGIPGELYLGGDGVAKGYWCEPDLTAEKFVPDRFSGTEGGRLYRTGDIASFRDDGNIEFLGRRDRQIKLSGYRIELAEIETALQAHPLVAQAAVVVTDDDPARLVGFVVAPSGVSPATLRDDLTARLPAFMVPAQLQICASLPLTPSGKTDRADLLQQVVPQTGQSHNSPPESATEKALAEIWQELLRAEDIGLDDNFFDLGGHSLAATRLLSRVRRRFQVEVPMRGFFDQPTLRGLAGLVADGAPVA
jgi:amino acid adenylation domain-containing protein